jgi:hypothetical protein
VLKSSWAISPVNVELKTSISDISSISIITRSMMMETEGIYEILVFSSKLTWLIAWEGFSTRWLWILEHNYQSNNIPCNWVNTECNSWALLNDDGAPCNSHLICALLCAYNDYIFNLLWSVTWFHVIVYFNTGLKFYCSELYVWNHNRFQSEVIECIIVVQYTSLCLNQRVVQLYVLFLIWSSPVRIRPYVCGFICRLER